MSINNPRISIIVPVYKVESYIKECIESILGQSFTDFELILIDDGSTDSSSEICDNYAQKDKRIVVIHKENGGASTARNAGLEISKGEYISFIDSDDFVSKDFLLELFKAIEGYDMSMCYYFDYANGSITKIGKGEYKVDSNQFWYLSLGGANGNVVWNKLWKKSLFNAIRFKEGTIIEDEFIRHYLICSCKKIHIIDQALYYYRKNPSSVMSVQKQFERRLIFLDVLIDRIKYSDIVSNDPLLNVSVCAFLLTSAKMNFLQRKIAKQKIKEFKNSTKLNNGRLSFGTKNRLIFWRIHPKIYLFLVNIYNFIFRNGGN